MIPRKRSVPNLHTKMTTSRDAHVAHLARMQGRTHEGVCIGADNLTKEDLFLTYRFRHCYIIGSTGSGKTVLLTSLIHHDFNAEPRCGVGILAKENDQIEDETLPFVPRHRLDETVYLNPTAKHPLCINPLELPPAVDIHQHVGELLGIFSGLLGITAFTQIALCRYMLYALVAHPESSLEHIPKFLGEDPDYRWGIINEVKKHYDMDIVVEAFERFDSPKNPQKAAAFYIIEKFIPFVINPKLRAMMCGKTTLSVPEVMQNNGIFIANLSDAGDVLGESESNLLGAYLITVMKREMSNRQKINKQKRAKYPFMLYLDEFSKYLTGQGGGKSNEDAFTEFIIRARKNFVALHLAHQDTGDLSDNLYTKLGGVGARVFLNLAFSDAQKASRFILLEQEVDGQFVDVKVSPNKLSRMTPGECYISLYHPDTKTKEWHHAQTFNFTEKGDPEVAQQIKDQSSVNQVEPEMSDNAPYSSSGPSPGTKRPNPSPKEQNANESKSEPFETPYKNTNHSLDDFESP